MCTAYSLDNTHMPLNISVSLTVLWDLLLWSSFPLIQLKLVSVFFSAATKPNSFVLIRSLIHNSRLSQPCVLSSAPRNRDHS